MPAYIHSFGTYIPPREISNEELSQFPPASLARIKIKTGVEKRRFSDGGALFRLLDAPQRTAFKKSVSSGFRGYGYFSHIDSR